LNNIHIKQQAITIAVIPIFLTVIFIESYGIYTRFGDLDSALMEHSRSLVKQLATTSEFAVFSGNDALLKRNIDATLNQPDVSQVIIYDAFKNVLASSPKPDRLEQPPIDFGASDLLYENKKSLWLYEPIIPLEINIDAPINDDNSKINRNKSLGSVLVKISKYRLNNSKVSILTLTFLITAVIMLFAVIVAYRLSKRITDPISELSKGIISIGKGNLDTLIASSEIIELDQLASGVNNMTLQLKNDKNDLQKRINEATQDLLQKRKQAEDASKAKSRFLSAASHDLRQPIAASSLYIDTLKLTNLSPHQQKIVERLKESTSSMTGLLNSLLEISKLDSGTIKPNIVAFDIGQLYSRVEANFQSLAERKGLSFNIFISRRNPLMVKTDIDLIDRVMINLVSNAIKFTLRGGILVSARRRGKEVLLQVWDTGIGIKDENIKYIYDEFYQVGNPQRDRMLGLGLGLAIVKRSVELLGTEITCQSRPGRGTVFSLRLPFFDEPMSTETASVNRTDNKPNLLGKRFVIIEDNVFVANALTGWIEGNGGKTIHYTNAQEALLDSDIGITEYYVVDHMLSGEFNGIELLNLLKQKFAKPIRAVVITGDTSAAFMKESARCEWPILHKPIDTFSLLASLGI